MQLPQRKNSQEEPATPQFNNYKELTQYQGQSLEMIR